MVATPGHTSDSLSFVVPQDRAVLTGDTVLGRGTTVVAHPDGQLGAYLSSLQRLHALCGEQGITTVWPGHGPVIDDALGALDFYLAHRQQRLEQVRARPARPARGRAGGRVVPARDPAPRDRRGRLRRRRPGAVGRGGAVGARPAGVPPGQLTLACRSPRGVRWSHEQPAPTRRRPVPRPRPGRRRARRHPRRRPRPPDARATDWTVRELADHLAAAPEHFLQQARGEEVDWSAGTGVEPTQLGRATSACTPTTCSTTGTTSPTTRSAQADWQSAELGVHTWDLVRALGRPMPLDDEVAERGLAFMQQGLTADNRGEAFGARGRRPRRRPGLRPAGGVRRSRPARLSRRTARSGESSDWSSARPICDHFHWTTSTTCDGTCRRTDRTPARTGGARAPVGARRSVYDASTSRRRQSHRSARSTAIAAATAEADEQRQLDAERRRRGVGREVVGQLLRRGAVEVGDEVDGEAEGGGGPGLDHPDASGARCWCRPPAAS